MKLITLFFAYFGTLGVAASPYDCTMKVRNNLNDPFEMVTGSFKGDGGLDLKAKGFTLKVRTTIIEGEEKVALWIGRHSTESAATIVEPNQKHIYVNIVLNDPFAIGECERKN